MNPRTESGRMGAIEVHVDRSDGEQIAGATFNVSGHAAIPVANLVTAGFSFRLPGQRAGFGLS
jgi:hypothetical protein